MRPLRPPPLASPIVWLALAAASLATDYVVGPQIQLAILFTAPVVLAAWSSGLGWGLALAAVLPLVRLAYAWEWRPLASDLVVVADHVVDVVVLAAFALFAARMRRQQQELRTLQGMLPICGFCKRVREGDDRWTAIETVVARGSGAEFSHTFCPDCARRHYGEYLDAPTRKP
jgi:hypothetical protein